MGSRGLSSKKGLKTSSNSKSNAEWSEDAKKWQSLPHEEASKISQSLWKKMSYDELYNQGLNDTGLQRIANYLNMHEQGVVLPDADFDKQAKTAALDGVVIHRGASQRAIENLMFGDKMYIGDGIHGNGIYFSTYVGTALSYGDFRTTAYIDKGLAKVIDEKKLRKMFESVPYEVRKQYSSNSNDALSIFAIHQGYNVIRAKGGNGSRTHKNGGEDYYIPLTRKVLVFREHFDRNKYMRRIRW